jgi:hypothetical protein
MVTANWKVGLFISCLLAIGLMTTGVLHGKLHWYEWIVAVCIVGFWIRYVTNFRIVGRRT